MNCPNCNKPIPDKLILSESGKIRGSKTSKRKAESSKNNGKKNKGKSNVKVFGELDGMITDNGDSNE